MTDFEFFDAIHITRQSNAQYCCPDMAGDEARGFCLDAVDDLPAGSTIRLEPEPGMTIGPFCSTTQSWREALSD
ncbi:hypothetical protein [Paraburkholderia sp. BCC1885]|uniref:hypothetical protein n=1 Tax=Paraburkholderia sp. BCC1885 TaxID=2562669 RepID=UPI0011823857|nr:hypothetical protein [Paraburkholderia sp. BCC1885]